MEKNELSGLFLKSLRKVQPNICLGTIQEENQNKAPLSFLRLAKVKKLGSNCHKLRFMRIQMGREVDNVS